MKAKIIEGTNTVLPEYALGMIQEIEGIAKTCVLCRTLKGLQLFDGDLCVKCKNAIGEEKERLIEFDKLMKELDEREI